MVMLALGSGGEGRKGGPDGREQERLVSQN